MKMSSSYSNFSLATSRCKVVQNMVHRSMSNLSRYLQEESYDVFSTEYFLLSVCFKFQINFLGRRLEMTGRGSHVSSL